MATKIKFSAKKKFRDAILLTGLPGIGLVGKISLDYLLRQLKSEKIGEVTSDSFPPSVHSKEGIVNLIKDEFFHVKIKNRDFVFLAGPVQPSLDLHGPSMSEHYEFAEKIIERVKELGVSEIYTLAGINVGERRMMTEPRVIIAATSKKTLKAWEKFGVISDRPEGLISGAAGLILGIAKEEGLEGACLMGETNARLVYGDHGAAKKIIEILSKKFGFQVKMNEIEKEAKEIEKAFTQLSKQLEVPEDKPENGLSYVR
ncbi:MAG: PAC2 family protein [Candidatus Diapherotrites archaeon]|nr:PAC2 family protein [Candidatus Diapherotrites archaeon]